GTGGPRGKLKLEDRTLARRRSWVAGEDGSRGGDHLAPAFHGAPAADATTLPLAHAAPDAELLTVGQRVLQAVLPDHAATAHLLRLSGRCPPFRKEQIGVDSHAVRLPLPTPCFEQQIQQCVLHRWPPLDVGYSTDVITTV